MPRKKPMDRAFIALLFLTATSGLALWAARGTAGLPLLLCLHLGAVMALFATLPYGKFAHGIFRTASLLRHAVEKRQPTPLVWVRTDPTPSPHNPREGDPMNHKRTLLQCALALAACPWLSALRRKTFRQKEASDAGGGLCCRWRGRCGGAADCQKLGENIGQSVVVDNKGGRAATSRTSSWPMRRPMAPCCCSARWGRSPLRRT